MKLHRSISCSRGFTLVELMAVLAILTLLMAILLPALSNARDSARSTVCLNNIRQTSLPTLFEVQDGGTFPHYVQSLLMAEPRVLICPSDPSPAFVPESANFVDSGSGSLGTLAGAGYSPSPLAANGGGTTGNGNGNGNGNTTGNGNGNTTSGTTTGGTNGNSNGGGNGGSNGGGNGNGGGNNHTRGSNAPEPIPFSLVGGVFSSYSINSEYNVFGLKYDKVLDPSSKMIAYEGNYDADPTLGTGAAYASFGGQIYYSPGTVLITHYSPGNPSVGTLMYVGVSSLPTHMGGVNPDHHDLYGDWVHVGVIDPYYAAQRDFVPRHGTGLGSTAYLDGHAAPRTDITTDMVVYPNGAPTP